MSKRLKIILLALVTGLAGLFVSTMFAEKGFLDLLQLQENKRMISKENSKIGLELYASIDYYRRLSKNDRDLIGQLAREQGMIGKDELVLIPKNPILQKQKNEYESESADNFRFLTDEEFNHLLSFDVVSLKFYEELLETD